MKQHEAKDFWPLIKAWSEGKTLQVFTDLGWADFINGDTAAFNREPSDYRIKPEPKLRAWKPEEVPVGALIRNKQRTYVAVITEATGHSFYAGTDREFALDDSAKITGWRADFFNQEHSLDGGKTWHPCGVMEDAP